jgi:hypothetical protein
MAILNPLSWQNENNLSNYPLVNTTDYPNFISGANFIQFDNFVPILNYILIEETSLKLSITFDSETLNDIIFLKSKFLEGEISRLVRIYNADNSRYFGSITLSTDTINFWQNFIGRKLVYNSKFYKTVVKSIPKKDGVYTLDSLYGNILLTKPIEDKTIFYNAHKFNNLRSNLVFNAVTHHEINPSSSPALKQINLVKPVKNNITLSSNDLIKISPNTTGAGGLEISLVTGKPSKSFTIPTLIS